MATALLVFFLGISLDGEETNGRSSALGGAAAAVPLWHMRQELTPHLFSLIS